VSGSHFKDLTKGDSMTERAQIMTAVVNQTTQSASRYASEDDLIAIVLHHWNWKERRSAARYLARHQSKKTIETLIRVIRDDRDDDVVEVAVLSLLKLRAFEALEMLTKPKVLSAHTASVRWAGIYALGELGNPMHFDYLFTLTHDPDWLVRNEAIVTLDRLISHIGETISPENQSVETMNLLIRMLRIDHQDLHRKIVDGLVRFKKEVLEDVLIEALNTHDEHIKVGIATALGRIKSHNALPALVDLVRDKFSSVRQAAIRALSQIGGTMAINTLILRLGDGDKDVVQAAIQALISQGDQPYAQAILIDNLRNIFNLEIKKNILMIMGHIKHPSLIGPIIEHLGNSYFFIRASATEALARFGETAIPQIVEIVSARQLPVDTLMAEALHSENIRTQLNAIHSLGILKNSAALPTIQQLSQHQDDRIAEAAQLAFFEISKRNWETMNAAYVLGEIGNSAYAPLLIDLLSDHSTRVRTAALEALRKLRDERAIEPVARIAVAEPYEDLRQEAVAALVSIGHFSPQVKATLLKALHDESPDVRVEAARGLGKIPEDDVVDALLSKLHDDSFVVQRNVLNALYTIGKDITPKVNALLQATQDTVVKGGTIILLGVLFIRESIPVIEGLLAGETDPDLLAIGKHVLQVLKGALKDKEILFEMYLS
jgi:HEAT repeat protein